GDVEARLDDRAAYQQVDALLDKVAHHVLELALLHLAVRDCDLRLGHERAQMTGHVVDILDAIVDEEYLAAAIQLAEYRIANRRVVEVRDEGANQLTVRRRRLNDGK